MNTDRIDPNLDDAVLLSPAGILLSPDQVKQAVQLSQAITEEAQQWQAYLNALALVGFEQWLAERAVHLSVRRVPSFGGQLQPQTSSAAIAQLQVGPFTLGLVALSSLSDPWVAIPRAVITQPESLPHFYVLVAVWEEQAQVEVCRYLRRDQLIRHDQRTPRYSGETSTDWLPLDWFEPDPDGLLLDLRCLDPAAIPELVTPTPPGRTMSPAINAGLWLQGRLDELARTLSWVLLPPLPTTALRSPLVDLQTLASVLAQQGIVVPAQARGAYQDLRSPITAARLYLLVWPLHPASADAEWTLLVVLGAQSGTDLPAGVKFQVWSQEQRLVEQSVDPETPANWLYAQVVGSRDEQFQITVDLTHGVVVTLPPLAFSPEAS